MSSFVSALNLSSGLSCYFSLWSRSNVTTNLPSHPCRWFSQNSCDCLQLTSSMFLLSHWVPVYISTIIPVFYSAIIPVFTLVCVQLYSPTSSSTNAITVFPAKSSCFYSKTLLNNVSISLTSVASVSITDLVHLL